ncbi:hypothetical protein [Pelistega ratti]|uniref:hypothetical protein n=1 Tax=Pelistega ratti TaxID=2652177 RepID=UPI00135A8571|nr:hypothetical protein [Pelistega ratti]
MNRLEQFGEMYIHEVRDRSLSLLYKLLEGKIKAPRLLKLQEELNNVDDQKRKVIEELSEVLIDNTLHHMLLLFEEYPEFELICKNQNLASLSDGLSGELYAEDGWIKKYSQYPSSFDEFE